MYWDLGRYIPFVAAFPGTASNEREWKESGCVFLEEGREGGREPSLQVVWWEQLPRHLFRPYFSGYRTSHSLPLLIPPIVDAWAIHPLTAAGTVSKNVTIACQAYSLLKISTNMRMADFACSTWFCFKCCFDF